MPDGTRLLGVHAAPGTDDGVGIRTTQSDDELRGILSGCGAELVFVGHTHAALDRTVDGIRVVNLGSLSIPLTPDRRAAYALLDADERGYSVEPRRVEYDLEAGVARVAASGQPGARFVTARLRGQV